MVSQTNTEEAERFKVKANKFFKEKKYEDAVEMYSKAIAINPSAVYYANRSFAQIKLEFFGYALEDASEAIKLDPTYIKAFYRRATAQMALGKIKEALSDYQKVCKLVPNDSDAKAKREECKKMLRRKAFEAAIAMEEKESPLDIFQMDSFVVPESYKGPHLTKIEGEKVDYSITPEFMKELLDFFKSQGRLDKNYAMVILKKIREYLKEQKNMVEIDVPDGRKFTICGDVHGQFYDLYHIFELNGLPSEENPYLFNGDFVDRGAFSVECIFTLFGFKLLYPDHFFMSRGNHETDNMNQVYGFTNEVKEKYSSTMYEIFSDIFNQLPLCHLINERILVTHGGIFSDPTYNIQELQKLDRVQQPPDIGPMCDLLWSDPHDGDGIIPSKRGVGIQFGSDITAAFCKNNKLDYIIRSHEVKDEGYEFAHEKRCLTVFSAPNYCDTMANKGAFINLKGSHTSRMEPEIKTFKESPHPPVKPMQYANSLMPMMFN